MTRTAVSTGGPEEPDIAALIEMLKGELRGMNPVADPEGYNRLFGDLVALEQRRRLGGA